MLYLIKYFDLEGMERDEILDVESATLAIAVFNKNWAKYEIFPHIVAIYKKLDIQIKVDE